MTDDILILERQREPVDELWTQIREEVKGIFGAMVAHRRVALPSGGANQQKVYEASAKTLHEQWRGKIDWVSRKRASAQ